MSFATNNLSVLAYSSGFTLWHYRTHDELSTVKDRGYFNTATNMLRVGDAIYAQVAEGTASIAVMSNDGLNVSVDSTL